MPSLSQRGNSGSQKGEESKMGASCDMNRLSTLCRTAGKYKLCTFIITIYDDDNFDSDTCIFFHNFLSFVIYNVSVATKNI